MTERAFYVYAIFRPDGSPCYVGKGKGDRWRHNGKYGRNYHLLRIVAKAKAEGQEIVRVKLAEDLTEGEALDLEAFFIASVGREAHGGPLVNLSDGGDRGPVGFKWTPELNAINPRFRGKSHRPESRELTSAALKGRPKTAEHIAKAGAARRGITQVSGWWSTEEGRAKQRANNSGHAGHKHSPETVEKIRRATIRQFASAQARKAVQTSSTWANLNSVRYPSSAVVNA